MNKPRGKPKKKNTFNFNCKKENTPGIMFFSYDTSFLNRKQVVINGDVESNPGPISSVETYRAAIGRFNCRKQFKTKHVPNLYTCNLDPIRVIIACFMMFMTVLTLDLFC